MAIALTAVMGAAMAETERIETGRIFQATSRLHRLALFLMAQRPAVAEILGQVDPAVEQIVNAGNGVVRYPSEERAGEYEYVVVENGVRYTSPTKPAGVRDEDVISGRPATTSTYVRDALLRAEAELRRVYPSGVDASLLSASLAAVERIKRHYDPSSQAWWVESAEQMHGLAELAQRMGAGTTREATDAWAERAAALVSEQALRLEVCGDVTSLNLAMLTLFSVFPSSVELWDAGLPPLKLRAADLGTAPIQPVPTASIRHYLAHPGLNRKAVFWSVRGAARALRKNSQQCRRRAMDVSDVVSFHQHLFQALLNSLAAKRLYDELRSAESVVPGLLAGLRLDAEEVRKGFVEAEETRVAVLVSMSYAAIPQGHGPDLTDPHAFFEYLRGLLLDHGPDGAEAVIHDMAIRLICPEIQRDLALGWLDVAQGRTDAWRIRRLRHVVDRLEQDLPYNAMRGNPNYLTDAYRLLSGLHRASCNTADAVEYEDRAAPENLNARVQGAVDTLIRERRANP